MKKNILLPLLSFLLVLQFSCKNDPLADCFYSTGKITSESRECSQNFSTITVYDNINLIYTDDSVASIRVEAGNNLLSDITSDITDGNLILHNNNRCNWVRRFDIPVNIYVHSNTVTKLVGRNSGNITSANIIHRLVFEFQGWSSTHFDLSMEVNELDCSLNLDACDATVRGHANTCFLWSAGNGEFHGESLVCDFLSLTNMSTGDVFVNTPSVLWVNILDEGNVYYKGNPSIAAVVKGVGRLIKE